MNAADRFTSRAQIPMLILSVAFIAVLVTPVINDHLSPGWGRTLAVANVVLWVAFAAEYLCRSTWTRRRARRARMASRFAAVREAGRLAAPDRTEAVMARRAAVKEIWRGCTDCPARRPRRAGHNASVIRRYSSDQYFRCQQRAAFRSLLLVNISWQ